MVELQKWGWVARTAMVLMAENSVARLAPRVYSAAMRLGKAHGRSDGQSGEAGAHYFRAVADDYQVIAEEAGVLAKGESVFQGRAVLELGPGDTKAVGLLALLRGAASWDGSDAFDIQSRDRAYLDAIYGPVLRDEGATMGIDGAQRLLDGCRMHTSLAGLARDGRRPNLVISRAVLEHVRDVGGLFGELASVGAPDAVYLHKIDLRSHGIEKNNPLDFLLFPDDMYAFLTSHLGRPNRVRADDYFALSERHGLRTVYAASTRTAAPSTIDTIRGQLPDPYRHMDSGNLATLGLWLVQVGPEHPMAKAATKRWRAADLPAAPAAKLSSY